MNEQQHIAIQTDVAERPWHACHPDEALRILASRAEGLRSDEVPSRRQRFGENKLPEPKRAGLWQVFLRQFKNPLIYILLIAAAVSLGIGNTNNALFIFAVLLINATIGTFQESRAESSARELEEIVRIRATVQRDGRRQRVDSRELVPGATSFCSNRVPPCRPICVCSRRRICARTSRS